MATFEALARARAASRTGVTIIEERRPVETLTAAGPQVADSDVALPPRDPDPVDALGTSSLRPRASQDV